MRPMPTGCIFADKGPAAFVENDDVRELLVLSCITNSRAFGLLVSLQLARTELAQSYEVGLIQTTPIPSFTDSDREILAQLGRRAWSLMRSLDTCTTTSHAFMLPALLQVAGADVASRVAAWSKHIRTVEVELGRIQAEIDERCFVLYGIDEADRRAIAEDFGTQGSEESSNDDAAGAEEDDVGEDNNETESTSDGASLARELVSWVVGVVFGRFDVRLATGGGALPTEPEPFDPLPACSPGMLTGGDGLPLARPPAGYPLSFPEAGVLVDDPGHAQDLTAAVRAVVDAVFGADADRWWSDIAALLDPKGHDLRRWLADSFFEHHLKRYSKSRRKAPILWQLGTRSGRYSVWLYAHRLTRDSFFQLQNEVVGLKLLHEERQLTNLQLAGSPSASERKDIAAQEALVEELRVMLDEVKRVAPLWNPNLDDGVVLTMAPLWRLVPQYKPWQKELKSKWDELATGKYDWAHLAMYLWPERVVPKCATDRSLAIAHGLEDAFWVEGPDGKWKARTTPVRPIDELVRERSSSAVKAALKSLLNASTTLGLRRARGRHAASSEVTEGGADAST
ncbi:MAG: type II restriction endonuclease subunit M [Gammaproteobacteria bacterium]